MTAPSLRQTQFRLEEHFKALSRSRDCGSFPLFALEHGLSARELKPIRTLLRSRLGAGSPSARHWLLWVIYATEVGYDYAGDEYWRSFESETPGWEYHHRSSLKAWFRKFQRRFGGVEPSGPWAEHFSIIAWPITHAVLPLYLQRQFAKLLFDLRFRLAARATLDARAVGRLLAVHASHATSRFKAFLEQEALTGQIVVALLGGGQAEGKLIHSATLRRIVADLEEVHRARDWLKETQRVVSDGFKGIGRGSGGLSSRTHTGSPAPPDTSRVAICPNLLLRHAGGGTWSVFLEVKSFRAVASLSAELHSFLDRTRCRLNGARDLKPAGWLLSGDRKGALRSWPDPDSPLVHFERSDPTMDLLLESECRLGSGPVWLFRLGSDGVGRNIAGRIVRPGLDYIVATTAAIPDTLGGTRSCDLDCEGVSAFRLTMPTLVSPAMTEELRALGLHVARTIRVWPAGLPGRGWDGEGSGEWLTSEAPCFGIAKDHAVEALIFRVDDGPETIVQMDGTNDPAFVRLAPLPAGTHLLTVRARRSPELERVAPMAAAEGFVRLTVREPEPWTPGITSHPGLVVRVDPDDADLDTLWRNELSLFINGPEGFAVTLLLELRAADGRAILAEEIGPMNLPIAPQAWHDRFRRFLEPESRVWRYLEAAVCTLTIKGETLGTCTLRFEHDPVPLRWLTTSRRRDVVVRLVDESGQDQSRHEIYVYGMERPFEGAVLTLEAARAGCVVEPPGGLYVARNGEHRDAVVVGAALPRQGFQGLGVKPRFPRLSSSPRALAASFRLLGLWCDARLSGFLAGVRHRQVLDAAVGALHSALCGKNWARAERRFREQPESLLSLEALVASVDKRTGFGTVLGHWSKTDETAEQTEAWFVDAAARSNVCQDRDLSKFAFHLAREPLTVADHPGLDALLAKLANKPATLRGARLLALLSDAPRGGNVGSSGPRRQKT